MASDRPPPSSLAKSMPIQAPPHSVAGNQRLGTHSHWLASEYLNCTLDRTLAIAGAPRKS